jgi:hypothetical protein
MCPVMIALSLYSGFTVFKTIYNIEFFNLEEFLLIILFSIYTFFGLIGIYYWFYFNEIIKGEKKMLSLPILYTLIFINSIISLFLKYYFENKIFSAKFIVLYIGIIITFAWITYIPMRKDTFTIERKKLNAHKKFGTSI